MLFSACGYHSTPEKSPNPYTGTACRDYPRMGSQTPENLRSFHTCGQEPPFLTQDPLNCRVGIIYDTSESFRLCRDFI